MTTYRSPGIYKQEVFLKPKAALPTGVPGFAGFADEVSRDGTEYWVDFAGLPPEAELPDPAATGVSYDDSLNRLVSAGPMTGEAYRQWEPVSAEEGYLAALKELYRKSQTLLNVPVALHRKEEFSQRFISLPQEKSFLADAVNGFFDNGGVYCYVVHADASGHPRDALITAAQALCAQNDLDLIAVPDVMTLLLPNGDLDRASVLEVQKAVLACCSEEGNRFALLDAFRGASAADVLAAQCKELKMDPAGAMNGALYYPWIKTGTDRSIPPCGHVAGIYARTDGKTGVHKAPANEEVRGVIDLSSPVDTGTQDLLNPEGINCLRALPGRGIRVWGARTLSRDPAWRYVNVRRLVLTIGRWIDANLTWAAFEPNTPRLWMRIQREVGVRLERLWQDGALKGDTRDQAFYVKCDAETNPASEREAGHVTTEIGLAPSVPAEFIVVRIIHRAGTTELD